MRLKLLRSLQHRPCFQGRDFALALFIVAAVCTGCREGVVADAQVAAQSKPTSDATDAPAILMFDLPKVYWERIPSGAFVVTGFRIGYFRPNETQPLFTVDVPREAVSVKGGTAQVTLPPYVPEAGIGTVVVRLQTVTKQGQSAWSDPPGSGRVRPAEAKPPGTQATRRRRELSIDDLAPHPRLLGAVRKLVPAETSMGPVVAAFRNVNELALAAVICRNHGKSLEKLAAATQGPPRRPLRHALRELGFAGGGGNSLAEERKQAKQLLGKSQEHE